MGLRVMQDGRIIDEKKRNFYLVDHGLDRDAAKALAATARVVLGNYPQSEEITGNTKQVNAALDAVTTEWTLFTYLATHYRGDGVDILLLDYCH